MADDEQPEPREPVRRAMWMRGAEASSIGIEIALSICVPLIGAHYLEQHVTHWSPWTTLIGVGFGLLVAGNALARTARNYQAALRADAEAEARVEAAKSDDQAQ